MIETMAFVVAVGGVAAICYRQMERVERRAERQAAGESSGSDGGNFVGGADSWSASSWFGGFGTGSPTSGGSFDSGGGGGDCGGGD